jgi:hypothetical protein
VDLSRDGFTPPGQVYQVISLVVDSLTGHIEAVDRQIALFSVYLRVTLFHAGYRQEGASPVGVTGNTLVHVPVGTDTPTESYDITLIADPISDGSECGVTTCVVIKGGLAAGFYR